MEQISHAFGAIAGMVMVIFAAYFITKYVALKARGGSGKTRNFRLIDRFSVSKDKMFVLIAVGPSVYLVGVTNQGMTVIDQKDLSDFPDEYERTNRPPGGFQDIFSGFKKSKQDNTKNGNCKSFLDFMRQAGQTDDEDKE